MLLDPECGLDEEPRLIHMLPGRARLHVPGWSERTQRLLTPRLLQLSGVRRVRGNPLTGNVLVLFDPAATSAETILTGLRALLDGTAVASSTAHERSVPQEVGAGLRLVPPLAAGRLMGPVGEVVVRPQRGATPYLFPALGSSHPRRLSAAVVSPSTASRSRAFDIIRLLGGVSGVLGVGVCVVNLLLSGSVFGLIVNGLELLRVCSEALVRRPGPQAPHGRAEYGGYIVVARGAAWIIV